MRIPAFGVLPCVTLSAINLHVVARSSKPNKGGPQELEQSTRRLMTCASYVRYPIRILCRALTTCSWQETWKTFCLSIYITYPILFYRIHLIIFCLTHFRGQEELQVEPALLTCLQIQPSLQPWESHGWRGRWDPGDWDAGSACYPTTMARWNHDDAMMIPWWYHDDTRW